MRMSSGKSPGGPLVRLTVQEGLLMITEILLEGRANPDIKDKKGHGRVYYALAMGYDTIARQLRRDDLRKDVEGRESI
jgi:hypothetical protein